MVQNTPKSNKVCSVQCWVTQRLGTLNTEEHDWDNFVRLRIVLYCRTRNVLILSYSLSSLCINLINFYINLISDLRFYMLPNQIVTQIWTRQRHSALNKNTIINKFISLESFQRNSFHRYNLCGFLLLPMSSFPFQIFIYPIICLQINNDSDSFPFTCQHKCQWIIFDYFRKQ